MGRLQLNLHHVISFYFLAKEGSFSKASEKLSITQPAVTQHIQGLEAQFGIKLINMKKKRVCLTKAGEKLLSYGEELFNQAVATENFLKSYRFSNLSIGIASPMLLYLTNLLDKFKELYPSVRVSIWEGPSLSLVEELLNFRHDVCIVGPVSPYSERLCLHRILVNEVMVFVASPEYPLPSDTPIEWAQLAAHPLILESEGSAARAILFDRFRKRGLVPLIGTEVNNIEFVKELTRQKKGLALMFEPNVRQDVARGSLKIIRVKDGEIKVGAMDVVINKEALSPTAEAFLQFLKTHFQGNFHEMTPDSAPLRSVQIQQW